MMRRLIYTYDTMHGVVMPRSVITAVVDGTAEVVHVLTVLIVMGIER